MIIDRICKRLIAALFLPYIQPTVSAMTTMVLPLQCLVTAPLFFLILPIHYCLTNYPEILWFEVLNTSQNFHASGSGLVGWFWHRIIREVLVETLSRGVVSWRRGLCWRICFQEGSLTWLLAGHLSGYLSSLETRQLASSGASNSRKKSKEEVGYTLGPG